MIWVKAELFSLLFSLLFSCIFKCSLLNLLPSPCSCNYIIIRSPFLIWWVEIKSGVSVHNYGYILHLVPWRLCEGKATLVSNVEELHTLENKWNASV